MATGFPKAIIAALSGTFLLSACEDGQNPFSQLLEPAEETTQAAAAPGEVIERDVEAPDVFAASEEGLWDGRPSLGGVWVAHPDVKDPERVIVRNEANGEFVIGALFRRDRESPGPRIQVSSDAAVELGMLAGQPTELNVVALRREQIPVEPPADELMAEGIALDDAMPGDIDAAPLDPIATAAAAIDETEAPATEMAAAAPAPAAPTPVAAPASAAPATTAASLPSNLERPFIQIGIFSVEENAQNTAIALRNIGVIPTVRKQTSKGKTFWRVVVGPATTVNERKIVLDQVRKLGFEDAYFVTN